MRGKETWLKGGEAIAEYLDVKLNTLYDLVRDRSGNGIPICQYREGGSYRTTEERLDRWRDQLMESRRDLATDLHISSCERDYLAIERANLREALGAAGPWTSVDEAFACLDAARERIDEDDQRGALFAAARAVAALEIWGHEQAADTRGGAQMEIG